MAVLPLFSFLFFIFYYLFIYLLLVADGLLLSGKLLVAGFGCHYWWTLKTRFLLQLPLL